MITELIKLVGGLLALIEKTREARRQSKEWTVAEEEVYEEYIRSKTAEAHWQPDPPEEDK